MSRILVIEDQADLAFGLRRNLELEGHEVELAADGRSGLELAARLRPELVVLDLMLPDLDGLEVLRRLRRSGERAPVLILTARGEEQEKVEGLRQGADDYVTKPFGLLELLARVEALLRRAGGEAQSVERFGELAIDRAARRVTRAGAEVALAPLEYELLLALVDRQGTVVPREELLRGVWGYDGSVVSRTLDTHVAELRRKLEADPTRPRHLLTARKVGYRWDPGGGDRFSARALSNGKRP
jgi:DNA-binding response OmpR family regulator